MYKTIFSLGFVAILLIAGTFYFKFHSPFQKEINTQDSFSNILLYPESGNVTFKYSGSNIFQVATSSPTIIPNQTIVHTNIGKATVLLPDNSMITLDNNTEITINYSPTKTSVYQTLGTTYHRVQALVTGDTYQVQTPGTLAAVRGTKFAVKYDDKTKKTKVAVTEHKVEVSTIPPGSQVTGNVTPLVETITLEEGKTVTVASVTKLPEKGESAMQVVETTKDDDMRVWVDVNKKDDIKLEEIKVKVKDVEDLRVEMKKEFFKDEKVETKIEKVETKKEDSKNDVTQNREDTKITEDKKTETINTDSTKKESTDTKTTTNTPTVKADTTSVVNVPVTTIKKMAEDEFYSAFNDLFIKYFYLDDNDTPCMSGVTADYRIKAVTTFANSNGYPFTSATLASFAQAIDSYCSNKDSSVKVKLQGRFDDEFPYKENI